MSECLSIEHNLAKVTKSYDQDEDGEDRKEETSNNFLSSTVFNIPLILLEILVNLEVPDLLKCSLVNKTWLNEARKILRTKKTCVIKMGKQETCCKLKQLNEELENFGYIPFNGIQLSPFCFACVKRNLSPEDAPKPESFSRIFSLIKLEHVIIMNPNNSCRLHSAGEFLRVMRVLLPSSPHCLAEQFLRRLFLEFYHQIKTLSISYPLNSPNGRYGIFPNIVSELLCDEMQENCYQNLTTLKLTQGPFPHYVSDEVINHLISRSPRLGNIFGYISPSLLDSILESKKSGGIIKELVISPDPSFAPQYLRLAESNPCVEVLIGARKWLWKEDEMKFMRNVLKILVTANTKSLERLILDQSLLTLLVSMKLPSFPKVTSLLVHYDETAPNFEVHQPFDTIDLEALFPNLENLHLQLNLRSEDAARKCFALNPGEKFYSVRKLGITFLSNIAHKAPNIQYRCLRSLMLMLPNIENFEVNFPQQLDKILEFLWTSAWDQLQSVSCQVHASQCVKNLDDSFLGTKIQYGPHPSKFLHLKKFRVTFFHSKQVCQALSSPESVFLSEKAVQVLSNQFKELELEIQQFWDNYTRNDLPCNLSMEHLKGYRNIKISTLSASPAYNAFSFNEYECGPPMIYGINNNIN